MVRQAERRYPVILHKEEDGGYWVTCPAFEGCFSQGDTLTEALANIREAIALCREDAPKQKQEHSYADATLRFVRA